MGECYNLYTYTKSASQECHSKHIARRVACDVLWRVLFKNVMTLSFRSNKVSCKSVFYQELTSLSVRECLRSKLSFDLDSSSNTAFMALDVWGWHRLTTAGPLTLTPGFASSQLDPFLFLLWRGLASVPPRKERTSEDIYVMIHLDPQKHTL